jgi:MFS family permease
LVAAYALAAVAGLAGVAQVRGLLRAVSPPPVPGTRSAPAPCGARERRFFVSVFCFWFGASLNRPVLPPHIVDELHAPTAFFAVTTSVAALTAVLAQPWWGRFGDSRGASAVLGLSGLGAGAAPLLWSVVPVYWLGLPVEIVASGCWLGHLYGLTLGAMALAPEDGQLSGVIARTYLTQGMAAALAPLVAAAVVDPVGTSPLLVTSGLICLGATGLIISGPEAAWGVTPLTLQRQMLVTLERTGGVRRLVFGEYSFAWAGYHQAKLYDPRPAYPLKPAGGSGEAGEHRRRTRLPLALKRAMAADCVSCAGVGCRTCYGTGLR